MAFWHHPSSFFTYIVLAADTELLWRIFQDSDKFTATLANVDVEVEAMLYLNSSVEPQRSAECRIADSAQSLLPGTNVHRMKRR